MQFQIVALRQESALAIRMFTYLARLFADQSLDDTAIN